MIKQRSIPQHEIEVRHVGCCTVIGYYTTLSTNARKAALPKHAKAEQPYLNGFSGLALGPADLRKGECCVRNY